MGETSKENYFLNIEESVLERSTCLRRSTARHRAETIVILHATTAPPEGAKTASRPR
jgi:deoxycytidylate deaminase